MKSILRKIRGRLFAGLAQKQDIDLLSDRLYDGLYDQLNGLLQIQNAMKGLPVLRPMRGWAISPDAMAWVLADLQERESPTVIEFGSGQSTVILAAALKHSGGRLLSVEHDPEYSKVIQRQVAASGLSDWVDFVSSSLLESKEDAPIISYDTSQLPDIGIDVALIDGPPISICGADTRYVPLHWSASHLNQGGAIFLDDSNRTSEQNCLAKLAEKYPALTRHERRAEKGLVELR